MKIKATILNNTEITAFCSQMALLLKAGITPIEGLEIMLSDTTEDASQSILCTMLEILKEGEQFHVAAKAVGVFPDYVLHMISIGEESGRLDDVMNSLALYYEREENMQNNIRGAISYPLIMIGMMFLIIAILLTKVLPIFQQIFQQLGSEMNGLSRSLLNLGTTLNRYSLLFISICFITILLFIFLRNTKKGKSILHTLFQSLPLINQISSQIAVGRFASGMALTLSSGLDTFHSLDMVNKLVENKKVSEQIIKCKSYIENGTNFADALNKANIFSNFNARMIAVGFRTGNIDQVMKKIAKNYEDEIDNKLSSFISILEPTLVIILSIIVGFILFSVILPLMGIMSSIG